MVIVRKAPAQIQRTANWLSAELDLADQLAALGFFSSDDDALSTTSSSDDATTVELRRGPKKRYGGVSSRRQPCVSAGLIRDVGRKHVGWRRQRRLDNEMTILHGRPDVEVDFDTNLEGAPEMQVELLNAPPTAPLASLFHDSDALQKWQEFSQQSDEEQQRQLTLLFQTEQFRNDDVDNTKPQNFRKALAAAKHQLNKVGRPLCRQLRRLASPALMASVENELLSRMNEAAAASNSCEEPSTSVEKKPLASCPVTCFWQTAAIFKAYTEKITLEALCRFYDYQLTWPTPLDSVPEEDVNSSGGSSSGSLTNSGDYETQTITIFAKHYQWPPVRLANIFFLNQQQQPGL